MNFLAKMDSYTARDTFSGCMKHRLPSFDRMRMTVFLGPVGEAGREVEGARVTAGRTGEAGKAVAAAYDSGDIIPGLFDLDLLLVGEGERLRLETVVEASMSSITVEEVAIRTLLVGPGFGRNSSPTVVSTVAGSPVGTAGHVGYSLVAVVVLGEGTRGSSEWLTQHLRDTSTQYGRQAASYFSLQTH